MKNTNASITLMRWCLLVRSVHGGCRFLVVPIFAVRKGYHALAVALFVPALMTEPDLLAMAMAGAFAALMVIETLRVSHTPVLGEAIQRFMGPFTDARDSGTLFVTHFALLLGLAVPIWLFVALKEGFALKADIWPPAFAGIVMTGIGDAIASIVGSQLGRIPMAEGTNKTVEGTAAGAIASLASWCLLSIFSDGAMPPLPWLKLAVVTALSSLLEAVTSQLDNLVVPLHYFALVVLL
jgi:dolichol kinase